MSDDRHLSAALSNEHKMRLKLRRTLKSAAKRVTTAEERAAETEREVRLSAANAMQREVWAVLLYLDKRLTPDETRKFMGVSASVCSGKVQSILWEARKRYGRWIAEQARRKPIRALMTPGGGT